MVAEISDAATPGSLCLGTAAILLRRVRDRLIAAFIHQMESAVLSEGQ